MKHVLMVSAACALAAGTSAGVMGGPARIPVTKQDDLPRHDYPVTGTVAELVQSESAFTPFAAKVRADIEADLERYDIQDKTTRKSLEQTLLQLDVLQGKYDSALARVTKLRELEDKPAKKLTTGQTVEARIAAVKETGGQDLPALKAAFRRHYAALVAGLPWEVVEDELQQAKGQMEMASEALVLGIIQEQLEPMVQKTGSVSREVAQQVVSYRSLLTLGLPIRDDIVAVLQAEIAKHEKPKVDIWPAREVDLAGVTGLTPVTIAVWDTGVDVQVYADQLFTRAATAGGNGGSIPAGEHGFAYDMHWRPTTGLLYPMDEAVRPVKELESQLKGLFDLQAAIDSEESRTLKARMAALKREDVKSFIEDLTRYNFHAHGTHVAGIAIAKNPAARVLVCRLTGDPHMIPEPPTMEDVTRMAAAFGEAVRTFQANQVRVVNMSWVVSRSSFEKELEQNGIGKDAEERKALARSMFETAKAALETAMKSAPEILFVGGAGNSDNDIAFDEFFPPMFKLPNLLIAGAVDQAGEATGFTSFGPTVNVYANGFEVESHVPGGAKLKLSGTSMASPNVANLAAKLIAIDPTLTPPDVIELILGGCDTQTQGTQTMHVVNPKRSVELLRARKPVRG
jgi:subtilisin family serine protease